MPVGLPRWIDRRIGRWLGWIELISCFGMQPCCLSQLRLPVLVAILALLLSAINDASDKNIAVIIACTARKVRLLLLLLLLAIATHRRYSVLGTRAWYCGYSVPL